MMPDFIMRDMESKKAIVKDEFREFMNDRREVKRRPYRIVRPSYMRNLGVEQAIADRERESKIYVMLFVGALMLLYGVFW